MRLIIEFLKTPFFWWFFVCVPAIVCMIMFAGCTDAQERRILQCRFATMELEQAQREMHQAMIAGTVKYIQLDRVETAIGVVNQCVIEFTR